MFVTVVKLLLYNLGLIVAIGLHISAWRTPYDRMGKLSIAALVMIAQTNVYAVYWRSIQALLLQLNHGQ